MLAKVIQEKRIDAYSSKIHVINVGPHRLKRNLGLGIVIDGFGDSICVLISVSAIVESKSPIGHHNGQAHNLGILLRNSNRARASHEIEIEHTTKGIVFQVLISAIGIVDLDVHAI